jgi:hypothetical protein
MMSTVHELHPGRNFHMRISVQRGPQLVVRFKDGWEYPLDLTREQAIYLAP